MSQTITRLRDLRVGDRILSIGSIKHRTPLTVQVDAWIARQIASGTLDVASAPPEVQAILVTPEGQA